MEIKTNDIKTQVKNQNVELKKRYGLFIGKLISYIFIIALFIAIVFYFSYHIRIASKPIGLFILVGQIALMYIVVLISCMIIPKKFISKKKILLCLILLFVTLVTLFYSDISFVNHVFH